MKVWVAFRSHAVIIAVLVLALLIGSPAQADNKDSLIPSLKLLYEWFFGPRILHVRALAEEGGDGSAERPFIRISDGVRRLRPGSRLIVHEGVYEETVRLTASGLPHLPIVIEGRGAVIDDTSLDPYKPAFDIRGRSHIILRGFTVLRSRAGVQISEGSRGITVENLKAWRCHFAVKIKNSSEVNLRNCRAYLCRNGFRGEGISKKITLERCAGFMSRDVYKNMDPNYLNGDAFIFEKRISDLTIRNSAGVKNWDSGFDIKSSGALLENVVAYGNKNGLKLWGEHITVLNALVYGSVSQKNDKGRVDGMGVNVRRGSAEIRNSIFAENEAEDIKVGSDGSLFLIHSTVARRSKEGKLLGHYGYFKEDDVRWYQAGVTGSDPDFVDWDGADFRPRVTA